MKKSDHQSQYHESLLSSAEQSSASTNSPLSSDASSKNVGFRQLFVEHWHTTVTYCAMFWSFGMCVAFLGPTQLDLGCMTSSDMRTMSLVFFAQLLCMLVGVSLAGYLVKRCSADVILLASTALLPLCMALVPVCSALAPLALVMAVMGLNMGFIDCLANLQMICIFGDSVAPFLHALHFCYGMGAFISPMIAEPFLLNEDCSPFIDSPLEAYANLTDGPAKSLPEAQQMTRVRYAFWIMAAVQAPIPGLVFSLVWRQRGRHRSHDETDTKLSEKFDSALSLTPCKNVTSSKNVTLSSNVARQSPNDYGTLVPHDASKGGSEALLEGVPSERQPFVKSSQTHVYLIVACTALLLFIYDGLQSSFGGYVYSYAFKSIVGLNKTEGAYLNALFWGTFAVGRLLSIPLATKFTPASMMFGNIMGCLLSMTLMLAFSHDHVVLYIGTAVFGLFLSSVAPTSISLAEIYISINSSITSVLVVVAALGEMVFPVIVGNLFVVAGPRSFLAFNDVMCCLSVAIFGLLWLLGQSAPKFSGQPGNSLVWSRMCCLCKDPPSHSSIPLQTLPLAQAPPPVEPPFPQRAHHLPSRRDSDSGSLELNRRDSRSPSRGSWENPGSPEKGVAHSVGRRQR